jgi:hypothetical protein
VVRTPYWNIHAEHYPSVLLEGVVDDCDLEEACEAWAVRITLKMRDY